VDRLYCCRRLPSLIRDHTVHLRFLRRIVNQYAIYKAAEPCRRPDSSRAAPLFCFFTSPTR
jgi:hypothetical protein